MAWWQWSLVGVACLVLAAVLALALLSVLSRPPTNLGAQDGRLAPCPASPNCVCSQGGDAGHGIEPLRYDGSGEAALQRLRAVLEAWPRTRVVTATNNYLHAECTSLVFRFVDDVEFLLDPGAGVIQCRSASRAGRSDFGVNRRRIEGIRQAFAAASAGH
jgi:uncharacterized protein (DUF1499 family)